jgi:prevent-host-death family protein
MKITDIDEAKANLATLIDQAMDGEEVIIGKAGQPMVRFVPVHVENAPRVGGQWNGRIRLSDDFDDLPTDVAAAFGIEPV